MSDNQDLKSKILSMRQKNFGDGANKNHEKNDNKKPENEKTENVKFDHDEVNIEVDQNKIDPDEINIQDNVQSDTNHDISVIKENLNQVAKTNEKAFDLLANKFNESVEVILELTQRVEKLETVIKLQAMQESTKKTQDKPSQKGLKFFIFLLFIAGVSYFLYKFKVDLSILKEISKDFLTIISK